jgi:molybdenum cofactor cytidylyltransferase
MSARRASGPLVGIVLAAGASRRFGAVKQLAALDGRSLLSHAVDGMSAVAAIEEVLVVLGANAQAIMRATPLARGRVVLCREWAEGQAASLRAGVAAAAGAGAVVVALADTPLVGSAAIERVVAARSPGADAVCATYDGEPGHPVLLEAPLLARVPDLRGDVGARALLDPERTAEVACEDVASAVDVDTPDQLRALQRQAADPA